MEYRFRAKKSWNIPDRVMSIIQLGVFICIFFPKSIEHPWVYYSLLLFGFIFLGLCYRELSQKVVLTISHTGISYSGNDYIFANKLKNIASDQLFKILIADNEPVGFRARWFTSRINIFDQQEQFIKNLDIKQWQPLDDLDLEQALKTCFNDNVELANRSKILEMATKQLKGESAELGKAAGYFAFASVGVAGVAAALAFFDANTTIAWGGQYEYLIWGVALVIAVTSLVILVRSKTHLVALFLVPLIFTTVTTLFIHQSFMLLNFHLGQQKSYHFKKVFQSKDYETWRAATGETVECISSPRGLYEFKTGTVRIGVMGIVRIRFNEVCMSRQAIKN